MVMAAMQDNDTQKNGVVFIYYGNGLEKIVPGRAQEGLKSSFALPWRQAAVHFCGDKEPPKALNQVTYRICAPLDNALLCRIRRHFGTFMSLFAIPVYYWVVSRVAQY
jgi:hypothetical protein